MYLIDLYHHVPCEGAESGGGARWWENTHHGNGEDDDEYQHIQPQHLERV